MPRIDPLSLLKCLSVLLGPNGGIKSKEEVIRLANLMTKFSKKLVSKCIYIQILKSTEPALLDQFMGAGGWNLIHMWLTDGILAKNWALIQELLELLLLCPVDTNRLKSNHCPKLIKGLSKEGSHHGVRTLASRLVEQWLKMVKGEAMPQSEAAQTAAVSSSVNASNSLQPNASTTPVTSQSINSENAATIKTSDSLVAQSSPTTYSFQTQQEPAKNACLSKTSLVNNSCEKPQVISTSVYKITIRDGKEVLTQVQTDAANINNIIGVNHVESEVDSVNRVHLVEEDGSKYSAKSESTIQRTCSVDNNKVDQDSSNVIKDNVASLNDETDTVKSKDSKNDKDVGSDSSKSTSDKENRDKRDDKKSVSSDKKGSNLQSSSKSSSKHSSSSSKHSSTSSKHSSSSQRSSSKSSSSASRDKSSRDKEKDRYHSSSSSKSSSSKSKSDRDREREKEEKRKKDQAEKDKATLEKVQSQSLSYKIGKIPKKKPDEEKPEDSSKKSLMDSKDSKDKKPAVVAEKKKISISIENRKNSQDSTSRPKTVKTFNSKFRSTGLEEEVKPPPPRGSKKLTSVPDKKVTPPPKFSLKRPSPVKDSGPLDKKAKLALDSPPADEKKGGIKIIPAKPKLMLLQESDMFMDALTASTKSKEPRKRKRRASLTKDGPPETKKSDGIQENHRDTASPPVSPTSPPQIANKDAEDKSLVKPTFKFYQDTLETDDEKEDKSKAKADDELAKEMDVDSEDSKKSQKEPKGEDNEERDRSRTPTPENDFDDEKGSDSLEDPAAAVSEALSKEEPVTVDSRPIGVLKSVLILQKRKGTKKTLKWKTDLESIRYFELDETERVNVTKTSFTDMKQMDKMNEHEAFQMARKLNGEDVMEEKTLWKPLIPIDTPPPLVEPGKDSREKDIQYAREKGILQALYFHRGMIPDSAAEPDEERHHIYMDPKTIPLDDLTGNKESEKDYSTLPWPEPKPQPAVSTTSVPSSFFQTFRPNHAINNIPSIGAQSQMNVMPQQIMSPMTQEMPNPLPPVTVGGGGWRTGDGKIVVPDPSITPMPSMNATYPQGMDVAPMASPNMMGAPMYNQDGYTMAPDEMNYNYNQGPHGPGMYGPGGPPPSGGPPPPPYQGPRGPPMHGNRGRGGPGWFRGGPPRGMPWRGGWRGNNKQQSVCRQFKSGHCRMGDKCHFLHPGQNCPPF